MKTTLHYLLDPLCGWCYGLTPAVSGLLHRTDLAVTLLPTGLFSGEGGRKMDDTFASFAWSNDQRIERMTGQAFTDRYREQVLANRQQRFDSGPATLAITAVSLVDPSRELAALKAIQHARYVDGCDVTSLATLARLLDALGLNQTAQRLTQPDVALLSANRTRIGKAQALMREFNARGVPTLIAEAGVQRWLVDVGYIYSNPGALVQILDTSANPVKPCKEPTS